jgi:hypothetical protein
MLNTRSLGLVLTLIATAAAAELKPGAQLKVSLHSGQVISGKLVAETSSGLLIANGAKTEVVPFTSIESIDDGDARRAPRMSPQATASSDAPLAVAPSRNMYPDPERTEQLHELLQLQQERPSLALPTTMIVAGAVASAIAWVVIFAGLLNSQGIDGTTTGIGGALQAMSAITFSMGMTRLEHVLYVNRRTSELREEIAQSDQSSPRKVALFGF